MKLIRIYGDSRTGKTTTCYMLANKIIYAGGRLLTQTNPPNKLPAKHINPDIGDFTAILEIKNTLIAISSEGDNEAKVKKGITNIQKNLKRLSKNFSDLHYLFFTSRERGLRSDDLVASRSKEPIFPGNETYFEFCTNNIDGTKAGIYNKGNQKLLDRVARQKGLFADYLLQVTELKV